MDGQILDLKGVETLSTMPSKQELRAKLLAVFVAAPQKLLRLFTAAPSRMLMVLDAKKRQMENGGQEG